MGEVTGLLELLGALFRLFGLGENALFPALGLLIVFFLIALLLVAAAAFVWINFFQNSPDTTTPELPFEATVELMPSKTEEPSQTRMPSRSLALMTAPEPISTEQTVSTSGSEATDDVRLRAS